MRKYHRGPTVCNHWYSIHYMLEWFQEQQKTVHCYNAKDKKGNSACRADFPSQQSEHFRLCFPCPDELVTGEAKPWPRTSFSEKTHCALVDHWLLSQSLGLTHAHFICDGQECNVNPSSFYLSLVPYFRNYCRLNTIFVYHL